MQLNLNREVLHMLSEALSQYVENNENALHWFGEERNAPALRAKTELAETVLNIIDGHIAKEQLQ